MNGANPTISARFARTISDAVSASSEDRRKIIQLGKINWPYLRISGSSWIFRTVLMGQKDNAVAAFLCSSFYLIFMLVGEDSYGHCV
jgi:hypothetical protein